MINLIYLCFYGNDFEKEDIFHVLTDESQLINYCQESVKPFISTDSVSKFLGIDLSIQIEKNNQDLLDINDKDSRITLNRINYSGEKYLKVIELVNKYFKNK